MEEQTEPLPHQGLDLKAAQDASRKQILNEYERAGVDLPVVCLETVLDREISFSDYGASRSRRSIIAPRFRSFSGEAEANSVHDETGKRNNGDNIDMRVGRPYKEEVRSNSSRVTAPDECHRGTSMESMKILGVVAPDGENFVPRSETPRGRDSSGLTGNQEDPTMGDGRNPQDPNSSFAQNASTSEAGTRAVGETMAFDCSKYCCPPKHDSEATDQKYVVSTLQLAEAFDDEAQLERSRHAFPDMILGQGSLLDHDDDDATTSDSTLEKYRDEVQPQQRSGDSSFKGGSSRFRWAMAACCILHIVMVGLIIGFAVRGGDDSESQSMANASPGESTSTLPGTVATVAPNDGDGGAQSPQSGEEVIDTACIDILELSLTCYGQESEILVYFLSCDPQPGDWVAIYNSSESATTLLEDNSVDWLFTCGDQVCTEVVSSEVVALSSGLLTPGGTYRVHLIRDGPGPMYEATASSVEFQVMESQGDCDVM
jgi:hypothetical protein